MTALSGLVLAGSLLSLSCSPSSPADPGRTQGAIEVSVSTTGTGQPASFSVRLDGGSSRSVAPNGSVVYGSLAPGNYEVELSVPTNCSVSGSAARTVGVQEGVTSPVAFSVTCSAVPTGAIGVTTSTTGTPPDPDGYAVSVDGGSAQSIGVNGTRLLADLTVGDHVVELSGVAANCLVQGENPRTVSVSQNQTTQTEFEVACSPTTGQIDVSVTTTGEDIDPDGYEVDVDGVSPRPVDANGSVSFTGVPQGTRTVTLEGLAPNCTVSSDNPVSVDVVAGAAVDASFSVACAATGGDLQVSASTTGAQLDPNGYGVSVDGGTEQTIGLNGSTSFSDLAPGPHDVELTDVAANCAVAGDNPRTVDVVAGELASASFAVTCSSTVGGIAVTVTTTGEAQDDDGYSVVLDGGADTELVDTDPPGNVATFTGLNPRSYDLELQNVAANCTVTSSNPTTATVVAGQTTDVSFTVDCEQLTGAIQVNVSTSGSQPDPDGYTVSIDGGSGLSIGVNGSRTFQDVVIGEHEVQLKGEASNCAVQDENPRTVDVNEGQTTQVDFSVVCSATTGQIQVTVTTTGDDLDTDGYTVNRDDGEALQPVTVNGSTTFTGVTPGNHELELQNFAPNCEVTSPNPTNTNVSAGSTSNVSFTVECTRTTGDIRVITSSTGSPPDGNGYTVSVDGGAGRAIGIDDDELFLDLQPGNHSVTLSGVAPQCTIAGSATRTVGVTANQETQETFDVTCDPLAGDIQVNVSTSGDDQDSGYVITLDGGDPRNVGTNGSTTYSNVPTGNHTIAIDGVANNCSVSGSSSRSVNLADEETEVVNFSVTCVGQTGDLTVNTSTTGAPGDLDPDGYTVEVDGGSARAIGPNDTETYQDVADGDHTVELTGLASNCAVSGNNPRLVSVPANGTGSTTFDVTCDPTTGSIQVTTSTTGGDLDPDGYTITLDGGSSRPVGIDGSTTYTDLAPGSYAVGIDGVADHCTVSESDPQNVSVAAGSTTNVSFTVTCAGLTGDLTVNTSTTGDDLDADGYTVTVDGSSARAIEPNDTETYQDVADGDHTVELTGLASNCAVSGTNPRLVSVPANGTGSTTFDVTCDPTTGSIEVTTSTTGANPDPNGYTVTLDGADPRVVDDATSVTYAGLAPDTYTVMLSGLDGSCTVTNGNPQAPAVTAGNTESVAFAVDCP